LDEEASCIGGLSTALGAPIRFQVETSYGQEQFDVVMTDGEGKEAVRE
jgi:hypothetical protein